MAETRIELEQQTLFSGLDFLDDGYPVQMDRNNMA